MLEEIAAIKSESEIEKAEKRQQVKTKTLRKLTTGKAFRTASMQNLKGPLHLPMKIKNILILFLKNLFPFADKVPVVEASLPDDGNERSDSPTPSTSGTGPEQGSKAKPGGEYHGLKVMGYSFLLRVFMTVMFVRPGHNPI